jgi:hypothetical protein
MACGSRLSSGVTLSSDGRQEIPVGTAEVNKADARGDYVRQRTRAHVRTGNGPPAFLEAFEV